MLSLRGLSLGCCLLVACSDRRSEPLPAAQPLAQEASRRLAALDTERERWSRERRERQLDAVDPGELIEHAHRVAQGMIDDGRADLQAVFLQGETIFERRFTQAEGMGIGPVAMRPGLSRVQRFVQGPDALSCVECHHRGGDDGAGELHHRAWLGGDGVHLSSADPRIAPQLAGLGPIQALAAEMTADLRAVRAQIELDPGLSTRFELTSKGISFGALVLSPDGGIDISELRGVDADLVVKPFGWKGSHATLRSFARAALPQHLAMEPFPFAREVDAGSFAEVAQKPWLRDGDGDGVPAEITEGQLTSLSVYLALLDSPQLRPPQLSNTRAAWSRGREVFGKLGCESCHKPGLQLQNTKWTERAEEADGGLTVDLLTDVQVQPALEQLDYGRPFEVPLFSDLKRHDLGAALATPAIDGGVAPTFFVTRPLWGIGTRGNAYLHDGRARTLDEAIVAHGGEAQASSDSFRSSSAEDRAAVRVFLLSLRRQPMARLTP